MGDVDTGSAGEKTRKYIRIDVKLTASFVLAGDENEKTYPARVKNLSCAGIGLQVFNNKSEILEKVGNTLPLLKVSLDLINVNNPKVVYKKTNWIKGKVNWLVSPSDESDPILLGVSFDELKGPDEETINSFIADLFMTEG
jgi:c-di-GMP-binding flagellar brake protein YcgR